MILTLQRRLMEAGRIRIGQQVPTGNGKTRPARLETFRLTSRDRQRIDEAAKLWGGKPGEWISPSGKQWEVITQTDVLDVIVPPSEMAFSQHYEMWSAGGCQRRCDGVTETISDGPCLCDPDAPDCTIHTRLSVMLRDLSGLGVWRVDTQGYYAAVELGGSVQVIAAAAGRGAMLPARLRLEQRSVKRPDEPRRDFAVPVLDIDVSPGQLMAGLGTPLQVPALDAPEPPHLLEPVPATMMETPVATIAEQANSFPQPKPRANAAQPVPPTGLEPRRVDEVAAAPQAPAEPADDAWGDLIALLGPDVDSNATMPVLEVNLRALYRLMEQVDIWPPGSLHGALRKYPKVEHVGDLRKTELVDFCELTWTKAREAVKANNADAG